MVDFRFYLNKQGLRGAKGEKGDSGYSPSIVEGTNTINEYTLRIINEYDEFETPNLRGDQIDISDPNGTYVRYNQLTGKSYVGSVDIASEDTYGMIRTASPEDFTDFTNDSSVTPASLADNLHNYLISPDNSVHISQNPETSLTELTVDTSSVAGLESRVDHLEDDTLYLENAVNDLSTGLSNTNTRVNSLNTSINGVRQDLTTEAQMRLNADNQQQQAIDAERQQRETQDAALQAQLTNKLTVDNIKQGSNIIITKEGNNVTISSTGGSGGAIIDDDTPALDKVFSSAKTSDLVGELGNEVNGIAGRLNTLENEVKVATTENLGLVQPDGTSIVIDTNGKISATGGGSVNVDNVTIEFNEEGKLQTTVDINELQAKVEDLQLYKFPNATIEGDPTINNGQISNFSTTNYLRFPFEFKTEGRTWLLNGSFDTDNDVTTQQNIIDSLASVALAVRNNRLVLALSTNGTSFNLGEHLSMSDIDPNTKYYYRLSFSGTQYLLSISTDKQEWLPEIIVTSSDPIASRPMTISSFGHPFKGVLNLNDWDLTVGDILVWQGMDDVGISSRLDVNASNATNTAKDVMLNTNGLTSGLNPSNDKRLYEEVVERSKTSFDLSKFTVVGNLTITDDGIASGFSTNTNKVQKSFLAMTGNEIEIHSVFNYNGISSYVSNSTIFSLRLSGTTKKLCTPRMHNNGTLRLAQDSSFGTEYYATISNINYNATATLIIKLNKAEQKIKYSYYEDGVLKASGEANSTADWLLDTILDIGADSAGAFSGSIDLKQFSIAVDNKEVFNGNKTGTDVIKPDDYMIVGNPTISTDGIVSGFNANNYLYTTVDFNPKTQLKYTLKFTTGSDITSNQTIFRMFNDKQEAVLLWGGKLRFVLNNETIDRDILIPNQEYKIDIEWNNSSNSYNISVRYGSIIDNSSLNTGVYSAPQTRLDIGNNNQVTTRPFLGSVDLNSFKIIVDEKLVFQPTLRIPYTLSKAGAKIVDGIYNGRVQDVYERTSEALYYIRDDINQEVTLPKVDLYAAITRLNDTLSNILSLLNTINGGNMSNLSALAATPMLLSLEPTELDLEDSFNNSTERATFNCDLDTTPIEFESYNDDTDIDFGGTI